MAWIFRAAFTDEPLSRHRDQRPNSAAKIEIQDRRAAAFPIDAEGYASAAHSAELRITSCQINRLHEQGTIELKDCEPILRLINAELAQLSLQLEAPAAIQPVNKSKPAPAALTSITTAPTAPASEVIEAELVEPPLRPAIVALAAAKQDVHPLDRPYVPAPPKQPRHPGRSLADMLQSFMEETNIRWGEILAAALIVLCSVGLVVSLRNTLKNIPYFPAILFTLFTVAFHSAGLYTLRRWKLQAVSRVILIISLLLVPLTFCGSVVLQQAREMTDPLFLLALTVGVGIFGWIAYSASRELAPRVAGPLALGVLAPSMAQVFIQRLNLADGDLWETAGGMLHSHCRFSHCHVVRVRGQSTPPANEAANH
jgi:hypothetical protein